VTLILIGLAGGIITGVTPCVLPVLPVVLLGSGTAGADGEATRRRPHLVVLGLVLSLAVFTLFGDLILDSLRLPDDAIRWIGLVLLVLIGLGLLIPQLGHLLERPFYRFPSRIVGTNGNGFVLGIALGAVFVPCGRWPVRPASATGRRAATSRTARRCRAGGTAFVRFAVTNAALLDLMLASRPASAKGVPERPYLLVGDVVRRGQEAGRLTAGDPEHLRLLALAMFQGIAELITPGRVPAEHADDLVASAAALFVRG
jgi:hypothetical protein